MNIKQVAAKTAIIQVSNCLDDREFRALVRGVILGYHLLFSNAGDYETSELFENAYDEMCFGNDEKAIEHLKLILND